MVPEQKKAIIVALEERGAVLPCSRCGNQSFSVMEGYFAPSLQKNLNEGIILGGPTLPSVAVMCNRCGAITTHAAAILGLQSSTNEKNEQREKPTE